MPQSLIVKATIAVGDDVLANDLNKQAGVTRILRSVGFTGSAAAADAALDIFVQNVKVATVYNTTTAAPPKHDDRIPINVIVPRGAEVSAICTDAAGATSYVEFIFDNMTR